MSLRLSAGTLGGIAGGVHMPPYDRDRLGTGVLHFGPGAFHRAHQANYFDDLAAEEPGWGIVGVSLNGTAVRDALMPQDGLYTLVTRGTGGGARVIGALREVLVAPRQREMLAARLTAPDLRLITVTVTEKGYPVDGKGAFDPSHLAASADLADPSRPVGLVGWLVEGLRLRRAEGLALPIILSCDNLDDNGAKLRGAVIAQARHRDPALADWITGEALFPRTMVDSITPATDDALRTEVKSLAGLGDAWPIQREVYRRWVIEDVDHPTIRRLGDAGAVLTGDVAAHAEAKLRLLNAMHSTLAYCGLLRGHETVAQAMADRALADLCRQMAHADVIPTLAVPSLDLPRYADDILARLADPAIAHRLDQIAADGTRKLPVRIVPTVAAALAAGRPVDRPLAAIAGWMRFVVSRARGGQALADPEAGTLADAGRACTGDAVNDVAVFRAACPAVARNLWRDPSFVSALEAAYRRLSA